MEEANVQAPAKKGMSKGCLTALLVTLGVIILLVALGFFFCETITKAVLVTPVNQVQTLLAAGPVEGVDTEAFNKIASEFITRLNAEDGLDRERLTDFSYAVQAIAPNIENPSADDINSLMKAMTEYYPELKQYLPAEQLPVDDTLTEEMTEPADTTGSE